MLTTQGLLLPIELENEIMEHLRGDRKSLASCSLVCSRWSDRAREIFFSGFTATIPNTHKPEFQPRLTTLLEILETSNSQLGRYIRRLRIFGPEDTELHTLFSESMEKLLPHLRHIIELTLKDITWGQVSQETKAQILSLPNLACLHWRNTIFDHPHELLLFSGNFFKLERLSICGVEVTHMDDSPSKFSQLTNKFASLRYLNLLVQKSISPFLHALGSDIIRMQSIDTLELSIPILPSYIPPVIPLLKVTAPTLSTLKICTNTYLMDRMPNRLRGTDKDNVFPLSLNDSVNLKELHFKVVYYGDVRALNSILTSTSKMPRLDKIHILFRSHFRHQISIDVFLENLASLEHIILGLGSSIRIVLECEMEAAFKVVVDSMPELSKRGQFSAVNTVLDTKF
ncbi:hypothetical protein H0H92_002859 [Tricholoma furcatifolium]|nr:hypothetical protein H0H92_002859 [Tricholoma furcatifolium]